MKQIFGMSEATRGRYYLCYEIFLNDAMDNFGQKNVFVGKLDGYEDTLNGVLFASREFRDPNTWHLYSGFSSVYGKQCVFELSDLEVYRHIVLENI